MHFKEYDWKDGPATTGMGLDTLKNQMHLKLKALPSRHLFGVIQERH
jgi:hypothetical protein